MSSDFTNDNFNWWNNTTASTSDGIFSFSSTATNATLTNSNWCVVKTPDKDWMPYPHFEYEPRWHQKYSRYKNQMEHMWD
jgi:hypothetical protein